MRRFVLFASAAASILIADPASANIVLLSGLGNPNSQVTGGTQITFTNPDPSNFTYYGFKTTHTEAGITFATTGAEVFRLAGDYGGNYNTTGQSMQGTYDSDRQSFQELTISFSADIQALAFNWGAADTGWFLEAFDSAHNNLGFVNIPEIPFANQNGGHFYGLASSSVNIASVHLFVDQFHYNPLTIHPDYVFIDNFTTGAYPAALSDDTEGGGGDTCHLRTGCEVGPPPAPLPEPSVWAMLILGFGFAGQALRRRGSLVRA
ncbi:MAG: hypothetical protein JWQ29_2917 [Phenylobacterium sp.]|nr:hypothetical protein [Phenylobacterium sp.]